MENPATTFRWKNKQVFDLIRSRVSLNYLFVGKHSGGANNRWQTIALNVDCGVSAVQCKKKWENLQTKYKEIMLPPTGHGLEEHEHGAHDWPFFDAMSDFMQGRHTINPPLLIQSSVSEVTITPTVLKPNSVCEVSTNVELPAQISSVPSTSSGGSDVSLEKEMVDDQTEQPARHGGRVARPVKRRRYNNTTSNVIDDLASAIRDDMESQRRDRQEAQKLDSDLLEVLRNFLEKN